MTPPVITINGDNPATVELETTYTDAEQLQMMHFMETLLLLLLVMSTLLRLGHTCHIYSY